MKRIDHPKLPKQGQLFCGPIPSQPFKNSARAIKDAGVTAVVCLLENIELPIDLVESYRAADLKYVSFPIQDFCAPEDAAAFSELVNEVIGSLGRGEGLFVHCYGGRGRTGTLLACVLKAVGEGDPLEMTRRIYRHGAVENEEQQRFVYDFSPASLGEVDEEQT